MHSVKNRFLLMINNVSAKTYANNVLHIIPRDIVVIAAVLLKEQYSLQGLIFVVRNMRRLWLKRDLIMQRVKRDTAPIWFRHEIDLVHKPIQSDTNTVIPSVSFEKDHLAPTIAFCGTRGVPANYGGFETAVDQISRRFVDQGYTCEVFCRKSSASGQVARHEGRKLTYVDGHRSRLLDTFVAAVQTGLELWKNRRQYRHVFWFNNANLPGILITALARIPMSVNTDGLEWRRAKWSWPFKAYYWLSSFLAARICRRLISDSRGIQEYYRDHFYKKTEFIPYGAPPEQYVGHERAQTILARYGLEAGRYFLQITRIEPDNLPLQVAEAFTRSRLAARGYQMVFVGYREGTPYARRLIAYNGRKGVHVHEAIYDHEVLQVLRNNCFCYVHGNSVGGTNPALLEAMASAPRVIAIDCNFSREVLGECGRFFVPDDLVLTLNLTERMPDESSIMRRRVRNLYDWDAVAESYVNLVEDRPADYTPVRRTADEAEPEAQLELVG